MSALTTGALFIAAAQPPLGSTLIAVAIPSIGSGIGADLVLITGLLVTGYLVVYVVCQGPAGRLSDLLGHPRVLWAGLSLYVVGAACGLLARDAALLFVARCLMAAAGALVVPATLALLRLHVPQERRGRVIGLFGSAQGIAAALGPVLGGEIVMLFGWRAVFLANMPFVAAAAILLFLFPIPPGPKWERVTIRQLLRSLDAPGMVLLALSLSCLILVATLEGAPKLWAVSGGVLFGIAFFLWESKAQAPAFDLALLTMPTVGAAAAVLALQNFAMYGLLFQLPLFFAVFLESGTREVGSLLFLLMIGMFFAAPLGGYLTDRIGARNAALFGAAVLLAGLFQLWQLAAFDEPRDAAIALLVVGLGLGLNTAPAQTAALGAVSSDKAGRTAAITSASRLLGGVLSIIVLGTILGGDDTVSVARHVTMTYMFTLAVVVSMLVSLRLPARTP